MRPIASNIIALTYSLAKYLIKIVSCLRKFGSISVKNNIELENKLSNFNL